MRNGRAVTQALLGLGLVVTVAACGGGTAGSASAVASGLAAAAASQTTQVPDGGPVLTAGSADTEVPAAGSSTVTLPPVTRQVGKTGWYDGFAITVDDVIASQGFGNSVSMEVNFSYQNLGTDEGRPREAVIEVDGEVLSGLFDTPGIPGEGKAKGSVTFDVVPAKDTDTLTFEQAMDKVTLVYGDAADNQTKIPLATDGKVDSVEPKKLNIPGKLAQGDITIEVVRASLAPSYESGEKGKALLNLRIKLTCAPGCAASGYNTGVEQFSITGPDGTSVIADDRSTYCCDALYPETVSDNERNVLTFVVKSPGTGKYTLTYNNKSLSSAGTAPATYDFTA